MLKKIVVIIISCAVAISVVISSSGTPAFAQSAAGQQTSKPQTATPNPPDQKPDAATISIEVPVVTVDVVATTNHGDIIPGLKKENFRILEDGVPQTITNFAAADAPITMVVLMEFSKVAYGLFSYKAREQSYDFVRYLNKNDWVALETFDMKMRVEADFTQNKDEIKDAVAHLYFPGFSESNVFDALLETVDRLKDVKGKKSILLLASGLDTFSKHTLDQTMKELRQSDVTIFCVGMSRDYVEYMDSHGYMGGAGRLGYYQAENQLKTFANMTGGRAWNPMFQGEFPGIFQDVVASLRNQYSLAYVPANRTRDGKFHKIKVQLVAPDGSPLVVQDQKGKKQKYVVYAREGYTAPKGNIGD
ncbi:MAG TPA: VWA domain-containing protein [Candidatus Dormibacteraeota bacterium]|nr:VWA domain-containing protein [Candidatus Dormibacteraeota bacterium]